MIARVLLILMLLPLSVQAQGFAGLGTDADGFAVPDRDRALRFPRDHGPHPEYRIEWWYVTATLRGADGRDYGVQWTLFRSALQPRAAQGWDSTQLWMGHAAITTPERHFVAERLGRGGIGIAGVEGAPFRAFIDDWALESTAASGDPLDVVRLRASLSEARFDLGLTAAGPLVLQGDQGYSQKSPAGQASYYYSQPFYEVAGTLHLPEGPVEVSGNAWLDREWSSQPLAQDQTGWDWFSLKFDDGARMMGFGLRSTTQPYFTSATWIAADGTPTPYRDGALRIEPLERVEVAGRQVPVRWRVHLPDRGVDVTTTPLNPQAWMDTSFPYWEGPISFEGSHAGRGYLEMTGY